MSGAVIRAAALADAHAIAAIYGHHVLHGTATFDTEPLSPEQWCSKITAKNCPFLVIESADRLAGYASAARFRDRPAYARTCEDSIYLAPHSQGRGLGTQLLAALIDAARAAGFSEMIAVIGGGEPASVALHAKCGFIHAGRMRRVGEKFGQLLDTVYMQRALDTGRSEQGTE